MSATPNPFVRIRPLLALVALVALLAAFSPTAGHATTYYVSQNAGSDDMDGRAARRDSTHGPWKTLARASQLTLQPGDSLLLERGNAWGETLTVRGDGTSTAPITIGAYGTGERPLIHRAQEEGSNCVILDKTSHIRLSGLELAQAQKGIRLLSDSRVKPALADIVIEDCLFRDIANPRFFDPGNPEHIGHLGLRHMGWAIFGDGFASPRNVILNGLTVRHCVGLRDQGFFIEMGQLGLENVTFDANTLAHCSFNSIYQIGTKHFDITRSVIVYGYPWVFHPYGATQIIAGGVVGDATVRNTVKGNELGWAGDYPNCPDGCAYDFETDTAGVTFQDNFVHDTSGEAILFMGKTHHTDLIFDNNLFLNNVRFSSRWAWDVSLEPTDTGNGIFSNNTFFSRPGKRAFNSKPDCFTFTNNNEHATGTFAQMPQVTAITREGGKRTYALACPTAGATIRYTLDASLPTSDSAAYTGPVTLERSGVLNAKAFKPGCYPSVVNVIACEMGNAEGERPAAHWALDETTGDTVTGAAGAPAGTLTGAVRGAGKIGGGLSFSNESDRVSLATDELKNIADTFTITFWADPAATQTQATEASTGLGLARTAWWKLDETIGTRVLDAMGGNLGLLKGGTWLSDPAHGGVHFNGAGDSIALSAAGLRAVADTFTVSFWAAPEQPRAATAEATTGTAGTSGQRFAITATQFSEASGEAGLGVSVGTNGVSVCELADNYLPALLVADTPLPGWTHVTVVYQDRQPSLYLNGKLVKTGHKSVKTVHPVFTLGGIEYGWYQGKLADVRVFPRALTADEVGRLATPGQEASVAWAATPGPDEARPRLALAPIARGGGPDADHAGTGVSVGTNGISVIESSDQYQPFLLVDERPLNGWQHVAVVYRNRQPTLYLNGIFEKAGCTSAHTVHPVFSLGGMKDAGYIGRLDDVRVYPRVLTDAEIQTLASGAALDERK